VQREQGQAPAAAAGRPPPWPPARPPRPLQELEAAVGAAAAGAGEGGRGAEEAGGVRTAAGVGWKKEGDH